MSNETLTVIGKIVSAWRYPVKSMMGSELSTVKVTERGVSGDRAYAILDRSEGKIATAKNPKKWPTLFAFSANLSESAGQSGTKPQVQMTLPDGTVLSSESDDIDARLSKALDRQVMLVKAENGRIEGVQSPLPSSWSAVSEEYWSDVEGPGQQHTVTDFRLPTGTFFDAAMVHMLTTATLEQLQNGYSDGLFALQRFRPNLVVETKEERAGFVENSWIGQTLHIGHAVRLRVTGPCPRCVMTTLAQGDLPKDPDILRTALRLNQGNVGVYATVLQEGVIQAGDEVRLAV
ncbi:MAG: MOSC domain-containing protein [Nitrospira sp.]|nr:MOSC domain-containing protein [Nitrospira sp.]